MPHRPHAARSSAARTGSSTRRSTAKFADAVCEEVDSDDPIVLVQDYHFALAAAADPRAAAAGDRASRSGTSRGPTPSGSGSAPGATSCSRGCSAAASSASTRSSTATTSSTPSTASSRRASTASRTRSSTRGSGRSCGPTRSRSSGRARWLTTAPPVAECRASVFAELGLAAGRAARRGRRPARLHEGHRGAPAGRRAAARARSGAARPLHLRAAGRAEPDRDPAATGSSTRASSALAARINERFGDGQLPADRPAARAPRAARPCSATTGPPTSAT